MNGRKELRRNATDEKVKGEENGFIVQVKMAIRQYWKTITEQREGIGQGGSRRKIMLCGMRTCLAKCFNGTNGKGSWLREDT